MIRSLSVIVIFMLVASKIHAQSCSSTYPGGARNWSALTWSCTGGTAPTTAGTYTESLTIGTVGNGDNLSLDLNITLNGNLTVNSTGSTPTITVPAGVTFVVNGNFIDDNNNVSFIVNGTLIVTGTMKAKNNAVLGGTGTVYGGTLDLGGSGGSAATCQSGQCPTLIFQTCNAGSFCSNVTSSVKIYTWNGSGGAVWGSQGNWTPVRPTGSIANTDILIFNATGSNKTINSVPSQTVGQIIVTGSSTYIFEPSSGSSRTLTLTQTSGNALQIDAGSSLKIGTATSLGINISSGAKAMIGGQLTLENGNFDVSNATLILHTNSAPLARTNGQVSANSGTTLKFGDTGYTGGSTITLPNSIFVSAPTIGSLVMNRTNGATLGDQAITTNASTFTLGNLTTNAGGRIKFSTLAALPAESANSKIIGYAEIAGLDVNTGSLNALGFTMGSGVNNVGYVTIVRRTGASGTNTFNSSQSIASSWDITTVGGIEPAAGRNISFSWLAAFDNVTSPANKFQAYIFNSGPGWTALGTSQNLASQGPPRQTATVTTVKLKDTFTVTDNTQSLPIELASFTARALSSSIALTWKTATEKNNDYFLVEKMTADNSFKTIAKVTGAGTTLLESNYALTDEKPEKGSNYYRLKQVDFDGQFSYSEVVKAEFTGQTVTDITIYPNPAEHMLNFDNLEKDTWISITDSRGRVVLTSLVKADSPAVNLNEYHLTSGMYFVRILDSQHNQVKKIVIK